MGQEQNPGGKEEVGFPADRFLEMRDGGGRAANDPRTAPAAARPAPRGGNGHFEVFREDEVSVTSTRLAGGGWRWRLSDPTGLIVAQAGGYASEAECRAAIAAIQAHAGLASVR